MIKSNFIVQFFVFYAINFKNKTFFKHKIVNESESSWGQKKGKREKCNGLQDQY